MSRLADQITATLASGMHLPQELALLFGWIESTGRFIDKDDGTRVGSLFLADASHRKWDAKQDFAGTTIWFRAEVDPGLRYWFNHARPEVINRLCVFAKTGSDGSMAAFWLDPAGGQKIVHLGSGSGSIMTCVLANHPLDFLRLLAIGYDEICWGENLALPPAAGPNDPPLLPNQVYQQWLGKTFQVPIPKVGSEIVNHIAKIGDKDSPDPFNRWVTENT